MICYQDEKMYGEISSYSELTDEELDKKIHDLEMQIYGHIIEEPKSKPKSLIYDVEKKQWVTE